MKNSLTKTLLCGVMATTFFLINCQKAPSRGVKAKTAGTADVAGKTDTANKILVECSSDFADKYTKSSDLVKKLATQKIDGLDESQKSALIAQATEAGDRVNETIGAIEKIKTEADGCTVTDKKTNVKTSYMKDVILAEYNKIVLAMNDKGIVVEKYKDAAVKAKQEFDSKQQALREDVSVNGLTKGMKFIVSDKLVKVLKSENVGPNGPVYFKGPGQIVENPSTETQKADRENINLTICEVGSGTGDVEMGEATVTDIIAPRSKDTTKKRFTLSVIMTIKSVPVRIECLLSESKNKGAGSEFRTVFGLNLQTQAQLDAEKKKADAKLTTIKDSKKAKEDALKAATDKVTAAQEALDSKNAEVAAASGDNTKAKALSERGIELKNALDKAKEDQAKAQSELEDAIKSEGNAAQRT